MKGQSSHTPRSPTMGGVKAVAPATGGKTQRNSKSGKGSGGGTGSYMDDEGNLNYKGQKNDMGKGFQTWVANIEEQAANGGGSDPNSFLSRGLIMEFLQKKKEGKIGGNSLNMHEKNEPKKRSSSADPRRSRSNMHQSSQQHHNPKRRVNRRKSGSTMDHSLPGGGLRSSGNNGGMGSKSGRSHGIPKRSKSIGGSSVASNGQHMIDKSMYDPQQIQELEYQMEQHQVEKEKQQKQRSKTQNFKSQRKDPTIMKNHYAKREYKIAMEPHHAADGIMR